MQKSLAIVIALFGLLAVTSAVI